MNAKKAKEIIDSFVEKYPSLRRNILLFEVGLSVGPETLEVRLYHDDVKLDFLPKTFEGLTVNQARVDYYPR